MKKNLLFLSLSFLITLPAFSTTSVSTCFNSELGAEVVGFPKPHGSRKGQCLSAVSRRPVEKVELQGEILTVRNFTYQNRLHYAKIDLSKIEGAILQLLRFAPVVGDHAQIRIQFTTNAVELYSTLESLHSGSPETSTNELMLSVEGVPLVNTVYSFSGALRHELTMAYRMMSVADKKHYVLTEAYPTRQYKLAFPHSFYQDLILEYISRSERIGFSKVYDLIKDNCANELMNVIRVASKNLPRKMRITKNHARLSTIPSMIPVILKRKKLIGSDQLPEFQEDSSVIDYEEKIYQDLEKEYKERLEQEEKGVFFYND